MANSQYQVIRTPLIQAQRPVRMLGLLLCILLAGLPVLSLFSLVLSQDSNLTAVTEILFSNTVIYAVKIASWQAFLSTIFSLAIGISMARALLRRGLNILHKPLIWFSFLAIVTPTTVAAVALVSIWGRSGLFHDMTGANMPGYGLWLVVLAHVFFNAPLTMRVALSAFSAIPPAHWRIAGQFGMGALPLWRMVEWPAIKPIVPSLAALIFLQCFSSFALVLMLGGGPRVTTLEVAIYTAIRFEFDLYSAAILALLQLVFSAAILIYLTRSARPSLFLTAVAPVPIRRDRNMWQSWVSDYLVIAGFSILVILPLISLFAAAPFISGAALFGRSIFWRALSDTLLISVSSAVMTCSIATILILIDRRQIEAGYYWRARLGSLSVSIYLVMPAIVFGTSTFILLHRYFDVFAHAFWLVLIANILLSLPFVVRLLEGRLIQTHQQIDKLATSLNIRGLRRFWQLILPAMPREYSLALGISAAFSLGDLGVIALFGSKDFQTLPWLLYQLFNRYGGAQAELLAILMLCLTGLLYGLFFILIQLVVRRNAKGQQIHA